MKKIYVLSAILALMIVKTMAQPVVSAPTPPVRSASNVISIFSGAYTDIAGTNFNPNWNQPGFNFYSEITIGSDVIKKYSNMTYQGWEFAPAINAASMDSLHLDIWSSDCTALDVFLIDFVNPEQKVTVTPTASGWKSINIPLSSYSRPITSVGQFKFVSTPNNTTVYIDNVYFFTEVKLPTITGFSVPAKLMGDAPFALTAPTSNSAGAFSYTSSNLGVATISGDIVTIIGTGTSTITAIQAASGIYGTGSAPASFVVSYNPPTVAAPIPSTPGGNVISLFSNAYTNRTIDTWSTVWDEADVADIAIAGNDTKLYTNLNFCGIEFVGSNVIDASSMLYYHVDVWTPNTSEIRVKLIDFGANGVYDGGGDDASSVELILPAPVPGVWTPYNIPLSSFSLATKAHLAQMLFISASPKNILYVDNIYLSSVPTTSIPLPVSLADFNVSKRGNATVINWKTLSEINSKGFSIERSNNGLDWAQLQFVNSNGNSNTAKQYGAVDNNPFKGINYYRLKQVDMDGRVTYSSTATIKFSDEAVNGFSFLPNPAKDRVKVSLETIESNSASLQLVNMDGRAVKNVQLSSRNSNTDVLLEVANITSGVYLLILRDGKTVKTSKIIIE